MYSFAFSHQPYFSLFIPSRLSSNLTGNHTTVTAPPSALLKCPDVRGVPSKLPYKMCLRFSSVRNVSSSRVATEAAVSSEAASSSEAAIPIAAELIPAAVIAAQSEAAIHIAEAFIPQAASAPVNMKVSLSDLL